MANILLIDPNEVSGKAMNGILARGGHRLACVATAREARQFIMTNIAVDLVITEVKLEGEAGIDFVASLRTDCLLKPLPIVIYTSTVDRAMVQQALALRVQNFMVKPYRDDLIFAEIVKAVANPWRQQHFEEERSFCAQMGFKPPELHQMLDRLRMALTNAMPRLLAAAEAKAVSEGVDQVAELIGEAETAGAWGVVARLTDLQDLAKTGFGPNFAGRVASLEFVGRTIFQHLHPELLPEGFLSRDEINAKEEAIARAAWLDAVAQGRCPVVPWEETLRLVDDLAGCPVVDTVAAGFQMAATAQPPNLNSSLDLVEKDPGLTTQMLIAANALKRATDDEFSSVDDPRTAIGQLGDQKLAAIARGLITIEERQMHAPPFTWAQYWMFQIGMAQMARYVCEYIEMPSLESRAFTAGLVHDIGRLLLARVHPAGAQVIFEYARRERLPLREAELIFLGGTSAEIAVQFAEKHRLPKSIIDVMRWIDVPAAATENIELVGILALTRELCYRNAFGWNGETLPTKFPPLETTPAWSVLGPQVFFGFNLAKFETKVQAVCLVLQQELRGRRASLVA